MTSASPLTSLRGWPWKRLSRGGGRLKWVMYSDVLVKRRRRSQPFFSAFCVASLCLFEGVLWWFLDVFMNELDLYSIFPREKTSFEAWKMLRFQGCVIFFESLQDGRFPLEGVSLLPKTTGVPRSYNHYLTKKKEEKTHYLKLKMTQILLKTMAISWVILR